MSPLACSMVRAEPASFQRLEPRVDTRPRGTYLPVPRFPGGALGGGGGCLADGFLAVGAGAALGRSLAACLAIFLAGFFASAAAFAADWFPWAVCCASCLRARAKAQIFRSSQRGQSGLGSTQVS